jgi:ELWxxDGT repeat protein
MSQNRCRRDSSFRSRVFLTLFLIGQSATALSRELVFFDGLTAGSSGPSVTDGTLAGTTPIPATGGASISSSCYFAKVDGKVLFRAVNAAGNKGLWQTDGSRASEIEVNGTFRGSGHGDGFTSFIDRFGLVNGKLLFAGQNAAYKIGLWRTDGTSAGTVEVPIAGAHNDGVNPRNLAVLNGKLLFMGNGANNKTGLWQSDGTSGGTTEMPVKGAYAKGLLPRFFASAPLNGKLLFAGQNAANKGGLWQTDGTANGTFEIPVRGSDPAGVNPLDLTLLNGKVLFDGADSTGNRRTLWRTDGTSAGTVEIPVGGAYTGKQGFSPGGFSLLNGKLLFRGSYAYNEGGLWQTDGTSTGTVRIQVNGAKTGLPGLSPRFFAPLNGKLLFGGDNSQGFINLWQTDGTTAGTFEISTHPLQPTCLTTITL